MQDQNQPNNQPYEQPAPAPAPAPVAMQPQVAPLARTSSALGVISLIAGILAFLTGIFWFLSIPLGIASVILGIFAIKKLSGKGMGIAGLVLGAIGLLFGLGVLLFTVVLVSNPDVQKAIEDSSSETSSSVSSADWDADAAYEKITTGMTKAEVESITGKASEDCSVSESQFGKTEFCTYGNYTTDGASISVSYMDDKVSSKSKL